MELVPPTVEELGYPISTGRALVTAPYSILTMKSYCFLESDLHPTYLRKNELFRFP